MTDMRRAEPEVPFQPTLQHRMGLADEVWREIAPFLAQEGIEEGGAPTDLATLQQAFDRAVERANLARFTPTGPIRSATADTLRNAVEALADDDSARAGAILDAVGPEPTEASPATVAGCIGVALDLLDEWLSGRELRTPADLTRHVRPPAGHWQGKNSATDILALAAKDKAFRNVQALITRHGGMRVLYGSVLALAATLDSWSRSTGTPIADLARDTMR
ncbi:hypothetical protein ACFZBU_46630 [Embleya sp. NPDC008237]|uniref:hypothetical protein n=1 Tax=Embleya sp. NPDC008237 TaxID=3363978 RepID=UPI0036E0A261